MRAEVNALTVAMQGNVAALMAKLARSKAKAKALKQQLKQERGGKDKNEENEDEMSIGGE